MKQLFQNCSRTDILKQLFQIIARNDNAQKHAFFLALTARMRYNARMHYLRRLSLISFAAAILLMIAMCHPPMAFFRPMKIAVCAFGIFAASLFWRRGSEWRTLLASSIAILFNPIWPVHLSRDNWRLADLLAALIILTCLQLPKTHENPEK